MWPETFHCGLATIVTLCLCVSSEANTFSSSSQLDSNTNQDYVHVLSRPKRNYFFWPIRSQGGQEGETAAPSSPGNTEQLPTGEGGSRGQWWNIFSSSQTRRPLLPWFRDHSPQTTPPLTPVPLPYTTPTPDQSQYPHVPGPDATPTPKPVRPLLDFLSSLFPGLIPRPTPADPQNPDPTTPSQPRPTWTPWWRKGSEGQREPWWRVTQRPLGPDEFYIQRVITRFAHPLGIGGLLLSSMLNRNCLDRKLPCNIASPYRSMDGTCNNRNNPSWGAANRPFRRLLPAVYQDGKDEPRQRGQDGSPLPSPREVSRSVHTDDSVLTSSHDLSNLFQQWGQFLDHDMVNTATMTGPNDAKPVCCPSNFTYTGPSDPCFSIPVNPDDPLFTASGGCLPFTRSSPASTQDGMCASDAREQKNLATSFIDGSVIYGSSDEVMRRLRTFVGGKLKSGPHDMLPPNNQSFCFKETPEDYCFDAGDGRVNEHPGLVALHTVFHREHNRLAAVLAALNPYWDDERLFQESRKIVGAILQHVTYQEWLPLLLGAPAMEEYRLTPSGPDRMYTTLKDPCIINSFAAAAFRFGHSMVPRTFSFGNRQIPLEKMFHHPRFILENGGQGLDKVVLGLLTDHSQNPDRFFTAAVTLHLFEEQFGHGTDLAALNVQRGRDHALPSYNAWRRFCRLPPISSFHQHEPNSTSNRLGRMAQVYRDVEDVDLFTGGVSEESEAGALTGPTFTCLLALQFYHLKWADRFWYENLDPVAGFSQAQIKAIKAISMSRLLCDHTAIRSIQRQAFLSQASVTNPVVPCSSLSSMDLTPWRE